MIDKSRTRKAGGAGLGLALCPKLQDYTEPDSKIESESRKGTCVSIIFDKKGRPDETTAKEKSFLSSGSYNTSYFSSYFGPWIYFNQ